MKKNKLIAGIFLFGAVLFFIMAILEIWPDIESEHKHSVLQKKYTTEQDTNLERTIDFEGLKAINPDIIAWIYVPNTQIDYPILKNPYDNFYLNHSYDGNYNELGSIFIQQKEDETFQSDHMVLYGHNTSSGQMFGELKKYREESFMGIAPYIYVYRPESVLRCKVFSVYDCQDGSETYRRTFATKEAYRDWQKMIVESSLYGNDKKLKASSRVFTLSTCGGTEYLHRLVVHAAVEEF